MEKVNDISIDNYFVKGLKMNMKSEYTRRVLRLRAGWEYLPLHLRNGIIEVQNKNPGHAIMSPDSDKSVQPIA